MSGLEIVYTVHKFEAENIDEISINVGEKVIILEKDEGFNDGWWKGRNIRGEVGLFPISYTVKTPPTISLENKIDSLESAISKMKTPTTITNNMQTKALEASIKKPVDQWTSEEVATWLVDVGFERDLADNFKDQEISGDILLELTLDSLKELQVTTFGKRFKIHSAINALRQQTKKQQPKHASTVEARVTTPFPATFPATLAENSNRNTAMASLYNTNKQQQPYIDDDLVSDYSTVIRNSRLPPHEQQQQKSMPPPRPSIPLDMNLIASSPRLSTLVERQGSISSTHTDRHRQHQLEQQRLRLQQQQQQIQMQQRPISHQVAPASTSVITNGSSEWKRNTMNNIQSQETEDVPRSSTASSRYSFMRNSKLQSILPNTNMVRRSEDVTSPSMESAPDVEGWLYKQGDKYKTWNKRWFVLKSNNLFYFKSPKAIRMKGIINLKGYRIDVDDSIHPGKYCFKAQHDRERTFYFATEHEKDMRRWLKALMKATIVRDYATPVMSSSTIPTISLETARKMRPRPPSTLFNHQKERSSQQYRMNNNNNLDQQFALFTLDENQQGQPIMSFANRAPSAMSVRQQQNDTMSDYSATTTTTTRLKDSGFNSGHLTRSVTESSSNSSTRKSNHSSAPPKNTSSIATSPASVIFYPDEEDEDLIDPEHASVMESNRYHNGGGDGGLYRHEEEDEHYNNTMLKKQQYYIDWVNANVQKPHKISSIVDLCTGEALLEFLESLTQKDIMRPMTNPSQSVNVQRMDRIIAGFKFMSLEGVELEGVCNVRDVLNGNSEKILFMLDAIKYWYKTCLLDKTAGGKKMASGGTFGEDDQCKLRELEESESILPP